MRFGFRTVAAAIACSVLAVPVLAHHAVEDEYDMTRTLTLTGVVSRVEWVNPHAHLSLDVRRGDGTTLTWSKSASGRAIMLSDGRTFSVGPPMWTRQSNR